MKSVFLYTGSKWKIAPWVISHFPPHKTYIEPFGGSAGILLRKSPADMEIYNDMFGEVVNVFSVLRDKAAAEELGRLCYLTPYSRKEYYAAYDGIKDGGNADAPNSIERARRFLVRCNMGFGSIGGTRNSPTGFAADERRLKKWTDRYTPENIAAWIERMKGVCIENRDALEVITRYDAKHALIYCDPPYTAESWHKADVGRVYNKIGVDHHELLECLKDCAGYVVISGYDNELYRDMLSDWPQSFKETHTARNSAGKRTECLWVSPRTAAALADKQLTFGG